MNRIFHAYPSLWSVLLCEMHPYRLPNYSIDRERVSLGLRFPPGNGCCLVIFYLVHARSESDYFLGSALIVPAMFQHVGGNRAPFTLQKKQVFRSPSASERTIIETIMIQKESLTHSPTFTSSLIHPKLILLPAASISALFMPVRTNPPQCQPDTAYDNLRLSV